MDGAGGEGEEEEAVGLAAYTLDYAKSARSACVRCDQKIPKVAPQIDIAIQGVVLEVQLKGDIRISRKEFGKANWHHLDCLHNNLTVYKFSHSAKESFALSGVLALA